MGLDPMAGWDYSMGIALGAVVAVVEMQRALITRDFSVSFVHDNGGTRSPALSNVATMWSALERSILLWVLPSPSPGADATATR